MFRITVILVSVYTEREPLGLTACLVVIKIYSKNQMSFTYQIDIYNHFHSTAFTTKIFSQWMN